MSSGLVGSPVHLSSGGFALRRTPPPLGADGEAVLAEFGFNRDEIDRCVRTGWSHERPAGNCRACRAGHH